MGILFNSIIQFIFIFILSWFDFWVVKNITGRFLVGLKWDVVIDEMGQEKKIFKNNKEHVTNSTDKTVFWFS